MTAGLAGLVYASLLGSISTGVDGGTYTLYGVAAAVELQPADFPLAFTNQLSQTSRNFLDQTAASPAFQAFPASVATLADCRESAERQG